MAKVFVSYARADIKLVRRITRELTEIGFDFWRDTRNLQSGDPWSAEITDAIKECSKFLLFMSGASMASENVKHEVQIARKNRKRIVILRLEQSKIPKPISHLASIQWIDYLTPDWDTRIAIALKSRAKKQSSPAASESHLKPPSTRLRTATGSKNRTKKPASAAVSKPPLQPAARRIQAGKTQGALDIALGLEAFFSAGGTFYRDQCTEALAQIDKLRHSIDEGAGTSGYQLLMPKIHLLEKVSEIGDLIIKFRETPDSREKQETIRRELKSLLDEMKT